MVSFDETIPLGGIHTAWFLSQPFFYPKGCIHGWKRPVYEILEPLRSAHRVGLETGDFEFSFLNSHIFGLSAIEAGVSLSQVEKDVNGFCQMMVTKRHESTLQLALVILQTVHHLMGLSVDPLAVAGDVTDYGKALDHAVETNNATFQMAILTQRTVLAYVFGANDLALELIAKWRHFRFPSGPDMFLCCLFDGLVAATAARQHRQQRRSHLGILKNSIKALTRWARDAPSNCLDKVFLLEGELASLRGNHIVACQKYTCANALALDSKCFWVQALANERAAEHYKLRCEYDLAKPFFRRAVDLFAEWGAYAKAKRLRAYLEDVVERFCW
jgi:hypothetical protein